MFSLTRLPHRNSVNLHWSRDFDNLFNGFITPARGDEALMPALDIVETDDGFEVTADLPGVKKEDVSVHTEENLLIIEAESQDESVEKAGGQVLKRERCTGKYRRALRLGEAVDENKISARYHDGVLKVMLPRVAKAERKRVAVDVH